MRNNRLKTISVLLAMTMAVSTIAKLEAIRPCIIPEEQNVGNLLKENKSKKLKK